MNVQRLCEFTEEQSTHQLLLGDFAGGYSLGVGEDGLYLQIEGHPQGLEFPATVDVDGEAVKLFVQYGFAPPSPYDF